MKRAEHRRAGRRARGAGERFLKDLFVVAVLAFIWAAYLNIPLAGRWVIRPVKTKLNLALLIAVTCGWGIALIVQLVRFV